MTFTDTPACELNGMRMAQLMRREAASDARLGGMPTKKLSADCGS